MGNTSGVKKEPKSTKNSPKRKQNRDILALDLPPDLSADLQAITEAHPFTRTRLGLHALQLAMPELKRRYPVPPQS